jgi:hypothetical protein
VSGERLLGGHGRGVVDEGLVERDTPGGEGGRERRADEQSGQRHRPHLAGRPVDQLRDPVPHPPSGAGLPGRPGLGGPVGGAAEENQDGGEEGQRAHDGGGDADGADGAQGPVVGEVAEQQGEQSQGDGRGTGRHGAPGLPQRGPHGREPVRAGGQFLPVSGGQEQCVVGGRTDHQDGEDALHLSVHAHHVVVGQRVHDGAGQSESEHRTDDDHQGKQHAAVDEQQDEEDRDQRDGEQQSVDAGEGVGEVGLGRGRSGQPDIGTGHPFGRRTDPLQGRCQLLAQVRAQWYHALQGPAVHREQCGRDPAHHFRSAGEAGEGPRRGLAPVRHRGVPGRCPHDDRGQRLLLAEGPLGGDDLGRFGTARQEGGLVVGRDLAQASREGTEDATEDEPCGDEEDGDEPSGASKGAGGHRSPGTRQQISQ